MSRPRSRSLTRYTWLSNACADGTIVGAGVDTLTEWSSGNSGFRSADRWLRKTYPEVRNSVMSPNSILSSMTVSGAAFLTLLAPRFRTDGSMVTEAHPKVLLPRIDQSAARMGDGQRSNDEMAD